METKQKRFTQASLDQKRNSCLARFGLTCGGRWHPTQYRVEFTRWRKMWDRCQSATSGNYITYGAAGIFPEERWRDFDLFMDDMGPIPQPARKYQIDRKDNSKGYTAANCRWVDLYEQAKNRDMSNNYKRVLTADSVTRMLEEYKLGVPQVALAAKYGVSQKQVSNIMCGIRWSRITGLTPETARTLRATLRSKFRNRFSRRGCKWAPHGTYYAAKKQ